MFYSCNKATDIQLNNIKSKFVSSWVEKTNSFRKDSVAFLSDGTIYSKNEPFYSKYTILASDTIALDGNSGIYKCAFKFVADTQLYIHNYASSTTGLELDDIVLVKIKP